MMKFFGVLYLVSSCLYAFSYLITPKELNENINKKFPIEKKFLFSKFLFSNPEITIDKKNNLVQFICNAQSPSFVLKDGTSPVFRIYAKSDIRYNGESIYLKDIKIGHIENKFLSSENEQKLILASELLLNMYFTRKPIYKLADASYVVQTANTIINDVLIDDGVIKVLILE